MGPLTPRPPGDAAWTPNANGKRVQLIDNNGGYVQEQTEWCWAACLRMSLKALTRMEPRRQCEIVNAGYNDHICCQFPTAGQCNAPVPIDGIPGVCTANGLGSQQIVNLTYLYADQVIDVIDAGRPILVNWAYPSWAHLGVVAGYDTTGRIERETLALTFDPIPPMTGRGIWFTLGDLNSYANGRLVRAWELWLD